MSTDPDIDRRKILQAGGAAAALALAGCTGGGDDDGGGGGGGDDEDMENWQDLPTPETREGYLQRANLAAHQEAPWIYLNREYSVYGKTTRIDWEPRNDEAIQAKAITPTEGGGEVVITQGASDSGMDPH